ncbi:hypothetical protein [Alteromonas macleodii]|uniref:hypothetical protein n=1 Tax=Alteromonas macleodii TaxID=28108 RepID=UPI00068D6078|nr:hypothetical protein [Alteromonas macleodii]
MKLTKMFFLALLGTGTLACSDSQDDETPTPPISIETPNADRCEILDSTHCLFPWPSNAFTVEDLSTPTSIRVNLNAASLPVNKVGKAIDPSQWNRSDGFSPSQMIVLQVPDIDLENSKAPLIVDIARSLESDSPIQVIEASTGKPHLVFAELDANATDESERALIIRPMEQFKRGERYIVVLNNLRNTSNEIIEPPEVFKALRDNLITDNEEIEARRASMNTLFDTIDSAGISRQGLYLAWDFTVASIDNITERAVHIRDDAFTKLGNDVPNFTITDVINFEQCDFGNCPEGVDPRISREIVGKFSIPSYLNTTTGQPGSSFYYKNDEDQLPDQMNESNEFSAGFICRIPRSVAEDFDSKPKSKARASLYGHGLLGSASEIRTSGSVNGFADEYEFMFCATDWTGFSEEDLPFIAYAMQDASVIHAVFDRQQQGFLNQMFLARLMKHNQGFSSHSAFQSGGEAVFDNSDIFYDGDSQGGILGGALMALIPDVKRGVLGVPGMSYSFMLRRSSNFRKFLPYLDGSVTGPDGGGYTSVLDQTIVLSMTQMLWDRAEASGYAYHIERPLSNTEKHAVLLQVAFGDHQVPMWSAEFMARTINSIVRQPAVAENRHPDSNHYVGFSDVPNAGYTGSIMTVWDSGVFDPRTGKGTYAPPIQNLAPSEDSYGTNPHFAPRFEPAAMQQKSEFLKTEGTFVDTCEVNQPCRTH